MTTETLTASYPTYTAADVDCMEGVYIAAHDGPIRLQRAPDDGDGPAWFYRSTVVRWPLELVAEKATAHRRAQALERAAKRARSAAVAL